MRNKKCDRCHLWRQPKTEMYWIGDEDECKETTALLNNHGYIGICDECFDLIGEIVNFGDCVHEGDNTLTGNCRNKPKCQCNYCNDLLYWWHKERSN